MKFSSKKYQDEYEDAINEFVFGMYEKNLGGFNGSFYDTCHDMIENGAELSHKQIAIIEREMEKRKIKIPQIEQYNIKITIPLKFEFKGIKFDDRKVDIGDLIYLLNQNPEFDSFFEELLYPLAP